VEIAGLNYSLASNLYLGETYLVEMTTSSSLVLGGSIAIPSSVNGYGVMRSTDSNTVFQSAAMVVPSVNQWAVQADGGSLAVQGGSISAYIGIYSQEAMVAIQGSTISTTSAGVYSLGGRLSFQDAAVTSSNSTGITLGGGELHVDGLICSGAAGGYSLLTQNATAPGVIRGLVVNPNGPGGGVRFSGPVNLDGFSIKNTVDRAGLVVEQGGLTARNGELVNCRHAELVYENNVYVAGSAILVRSAGSSPVVIGDVDFVDCFVAYPSSDNVGGIVGVLATGNVQLRNSNFVRPRGGPNVPALGLCFGVKGAAVEVEGCEFVFSGTNQYALSANGAVAVGCLQPAGAMSIIRNCLVDYTGSAAQGSVAAFGASAGTMLAEQADLVLVRGAVFRGGAAFELADSRVRFLGPGGTAQVAMGNAFGGGFGNPVRVTIFLIPTLWNWLPHGAASPVGPVRLPQIRARSRSAIACLIESDSPLLRCSTSLPSAAPLPMFLGLSLLGLTVPPD
jgi:hypothetical protein